MTNERDIIFQQNATYFRFFSYLEKKGLLRRITGVSLFDSRNRLSKRVKIRMSKTLCKLIEYQVHLLLVGEFVISITNKANQMS